MKNMPMMETAQSAKAMGTRRNRRISSPTSTAIARVVGSIVINTFLGRFLRLRKGISRSVRMNDAGFQAEILEQVEQQTNAKQSERNHENQLCGPDRQI